MASKEDIIREADYYLNNDVTIDQASKDLGISKRTLQLHLKNLEKIDPDRAKLVKDKKESNIRQGNAKGGSLGKRGPTWTEEEALKLAKDMIEKERTYQEEGRVSGIPKSTLHDMLNRGVTDEYIISLLYALSEANKKRMTLEEYVKVHQKEHITVDQISKDIINETIYSNGKGKK